VAGCATGEEVYSVAIIIAECMDELKISLPVQLYGTDIDINALYIARAGKYPANIVADVSPERLMRFFVKGNNTYSIKKEIREMVMFAPQDFIKDPPFSRMDLIAAATFSFTSKTMYRISSYPFSIMGLSPVGFSSWGLQKQSASLQTCLQCWTGNGRYTSVRM